MNATVRVKFVNYMIDNNKNLRNLPVKCWPEGREFTEAFLDAKALTDFTEKSPALFKAAMIDHIIKRRHQWAGLISLGDWPEGTPFLTGFLDVQLWRSKHGLDFTNKSDAFKAAMINRIIKDRKDCAGLISLKDWPEGEEFLPAFLDKQLEGGDYKLDPQRRDFDDMIEHIISRRPDCAHLIEPSHLHKERQYSVLFKINYLKAIQREKLAQVPTPLRGEFICFMIEQRLASITAIPIDQWPKEKNFTYDYLKAVSDLQGFNLTAEQPLRFRNAMIEYIISEESKKAHLIAPSDLPPLVYTDTFMRCYFSKRSFNVHDLEYLQDRIRQRFIDHILKKSPDFADSVNLSWLTAAPSSEFIECFLGKNPKPDLENINPVVKAAFKEHIAKQPAQIVSNFLENKPQSGILTPNDPNTVNESDSDDEYDPEIEANHIEKEKQFWISLLLVIGKSRKEVVQEFLQQLADTESKNKETAKKYRKEISQDGETKKIFKKILNKQDYSPPVLVDIIK